MVIAYSFPPYGAIGTLRSLRVVKHLLKQGWSVTVLTGDRSTFLPGTIVDEGLEARVPAAAGSRVWRAGS